MLDILFCRIRTWSLTLFTKSAASLPLIKFSKKKPVLADSLSQVSPIHRESALRTLQSARFRSNLDPARKVCAHCLQESLSSLQSQRAQRTVCTVRPF